MCNTVHLDNGSFPTRLCESEIEIVIRKYEQDLVLPSSVPFLFLISQQSNHKYMMAFYDLQTSKQSKNMDSGWDAVASFFGLCQECSESCRRILSRLKKLLSFNRDSKLFCNASKIQLLNVTRWYYNDANNLFQQLLLKSKGQSNQRYCI